LRDLANGLHPQALTEGGLSAVLDDMARRSTVPVDVTCTEVRYDRAVEFTCWMVIAEAVVNAQKHAQAQRIVVEVAHGDEMLRVRVCDNGCGGADPGGSGLRGLRDRVEAAGGHADIATGPGGTSIEVTVPCAS
jgi:signal transduction histidine kinase